VAFNIAPAFEGQIFSLPLPLLAVFYLIAGAVFLLAGVIHWRQRQPTWAIPLALAYQSLLWAIRLLGDRSSYAHRLWGRDALLTGLFIAAVVGLAYSPKRNIEA
jgi:uncharacterized iron-regulated membrane protein